MSILVKNAKLVNGQTFDIGIDDAKITCINAECLSRNFNETIDLKNQYYVSPGWIDIHTHCFDKYEMYSDAPDSVGYKQGVTSVVDAGTAGADDIDEFYLKSKQYKTNVYSLLNISKIGLSRQDELANLENVQKGLIEKYMKKYTDFIVGLKIRQSRTTVGNTSIQGLVLGKKIARELGVPIMLHIGSEPPSLEECLQKLDSGDIVTHIFNGKINGIVDSNKKIKQCVYDAINRGVKLDLGHGTDSFNFDVAKTALEEDIKVDTISSDIYSRNRKNGPVYSLADTMTKMLNIGYTLDEVIKMVTEYPSKILNIRNKGKIKVGYDADLTIFRVKNLNKKLIDSQGNILVAEKVIEPVAVVLNGKLIKIMKNTL